MPNQSETADNKDFIAANLPLLSFMKHCGESLGGILGGKQDPREVMFPGGSSDAVEKVYQDTPQSRYYNGIMAKALKSVVDALPFDRKISILEIGAGTGGTTSALLPVLPPERTRYVYTDISPIFTAKGQERFSGFPFVEYRTLDISRDPLQQGFGEGEFDIVVCSNILHATPDITQSVKNIRMLLASRGLLLLREITLPRPALGFEISFGCLLGQIHDQDFRGINPFLTPERWHDLLTKTGFDRTACYPDPKDKALDEHIIIARSSGEGREAFSTEMITASEASEGEPSGTDTGHILLGRRFASPLATAQYSSLVSGERQPFLTQHQVFKNIVVPGTAHFDLAAAAGMNYFGCDEVSLENVVLREALMLDDGARRVQVLVNPSDGGADFEIYSRNAADTEGGWHMHVSGQVAPLQSAAGAHVNLKNLTRGGREIDIDAFYTKFDSYGTVHYGPIFRGLRHLWRTDDGAIAEVSLDSQEARRGGGFIVHPAVLDSCLQSMVAAMGADDSDPNGEGFMPFSVERINFYGKAPDTVWCRAVMKEGDSFKKEMFQASFSIYTPDGTPVCDIINLTMRRTNRNTLDQIRAGQQSADICYDIVWRQIAAPEKHDMKGHWLILAGRDMNFARAISDEITRDGGTCEMAVCAGEDAPDGIQAIAPDSPEAFRDLVSAFSAKEDARGILYLWAPDCTVPDFTGKNGEAPFKIHTAEAFLFLAQALAACGASSKNRLAAVTCQAQAVRAADQPVPTQSLVWGLEKSVAMELGQISPFIIDLDPVTELSSQAATLCAAAGARGWHEDKAAVRNGVFYSPRLVRAAHEVPARTPKVLEKPEGSYEVEVLGGGLENIAVKPLTRHAPKPGEIEIAVEAYGLNFQNVMSAMGVTSQMKSMVLDCAGTVTAIGEGVTRFAPGDRVFTTTYGQFASHLYARELFTAPIPKGFSAVEASCIPTVFMTSWHSLIEVAGLKKGERVLLHSATGGIGQSAIQIARAVGAEIYATAGTERKRGLLRSWGIKHVYSSRTADFEKEILRDTGGEGVHVVLNFLVKDLCDAGMRCLVKGGRFVEIGKTDVRTPGEVKAVRDDITYTAVDLVKIGQKDENRLREIFTGCMEGFRKGFYHPLTHRVFTMDSVAEAFRYMLEGRHTGKVVVRNVFVPGDTGIRHDASYVITGGMSDVGLALAQHLAERGAGRIWLLGRHLPEAGSHQEEQVEKIRAAGCDARPLTCDVTDFDAMKAAFGEMTAQEDMPIRGVFHLAGFLDDDAIEKLTWDRFNAVLSPKVDGSWFLNELTRDMPLDHFVVFSSIASVFGTHGQANHVAANTFLDALIASRRADFLPGLSVNWGAWGEIGTVVRLGILDRIRRQGVEGFDTATGLALLDAFMSSGATRRVVTRMDWNKMLPLLRATSGAAMFDEIRSRVKAGEKKAEKASTSRLAEEMRALPMDERLTRMRAYLRKEISGFLRISEDTIPDDVNLTSLGMDSLISLDLFQRISRDLKIRIAPHEVSARPTVQAMAEKFAHDLGPDTAGETKKPEKENEADSPLSGLLVPDPEHACDPFPLSDMQQAYWIGRGSDGLALGGVSCHFYFEAEAQNIDYDRYEKAWNELIARQSILRTVILDSEHQQVLAEVPPYIIPRHDLRGLSGREVEEKIQAMRAEMSHEVVAVDKWPNFRIEITELSDTVCRLHFSFDLMLCDFHGISLLLHELGEIYAGRGAKLPKMEITFRDYRLAEERYRKTKTFERDRRYWLDRIDSLPEAPRLPLAVKPSALTHTEFRRLMKTIDKGVWLSLRKKGEARGLTPTAITLAAFAEVLGLWSADRKFTLNLTLFNRLPMHRQVNELVGEFTSNTLLAVDLDEGTGFENMAGRLWSRLWDDMGHRSFSGIRVLREMSRRRGSAAGIMPIIFTSILSMESKGDAFALGGLGREVCSLSQTPQVWLDHQLFEVDGALRLVFDFVPELFPRGMIEDMFNAYADFLTRLAGDESLWDSIAPVRAPEAQLAIRAKVNDTAMELGAGLMYAPFLKQAADHPGACAVIGRNRVLSYGELEEISRALALQLREKGVGRGDRCAILLPHGWQQIAACLGIQRAGAAYLPLDPAQPENRIGEILSDAGVKAVIGRKCAAPEGTVFLSADDTLKASDGDVCPENAARPEDPAYIIYTSGSTGKPKGVVISHKAAMNTILDVSRRYGVTSQDRVLSVSRLSFDLSVYDIFGLLSAGGTVVVPDEDERLEPQSWLTLIRAHGVTLWNTVPALGQILCDAVEEENGAPLPLKLAIFSGDWIPRDLPVKLKKNIPGLKVMAMGGATEASIWSNFHETCPADEAWTSVPYGTPLANQAFAILDGHLTDRPDWVPGDLYILGAGLATGYWNDPEKTAAAFLPATEKHPRMYKTGDTARYHPDGTIEFLGRLDTQVKVHGYRIELGEVESVLRDHPAVKWAAVIVENGQGGEKQLTAFLEAEPEKASMIMRTEEAPSQLTDGLMKAAGNTESLTDFDPEIFKKMWNGLSDLYLAAAERALRALGLYDRKWTGLEDFISESGAAKRYTKWLHRALTALSSRGIIAVDDKGMYAPCGTPPSFDGCLRNALGCLEEMKFAPRFGTILVKTVTDLPAILKEDKHSGELYTDEIVPALYQKVPAACNRLTADIAVRAVENAGGRPYRILEVGAGYGSVTRHILPALSGKNVTYDFTDISRFFLTAAEKAFSEYDFVNYGLFDLDVEPELQGREAHSYDMILAVGVLHDVKDMRKSLTALKRMLAPSGILLIEDQSSFQLPLDLSQGLQQGYENANDADLRLENPIPSREEWTKVFTEQGLSAPVWFVKEDSLEGFLGLEVFVSSGPESVSRFTPEVLENWTRESVPGYMVPSGWHLLESMPLSANGKTDRKALAAASGRGPSRPAVTVAPRTETEKTIAAIWKEVLSLDSVSVEESFFHCGGDSLSAFQLLKGLQKTFGRRFTLRDLMQQPTIAGEAALIESRKNDRDGSLVILNEAGSSRALLFGHPCEGIVTSYARLSAALPEWNFCALQSRGLGGECQPVTDFSVMTENYLSDLTQKVAPDSAVFGGWSMGAFIAWELAVRTGNGNRQPLVLIDPPSKKLWDEQYGRRRTSFMSLMEQVFPDAVGVVKSMGFEPSAFDSLDRESQLRVFTKAMEMDGLVPEGSQAVQEQVSRIIKVGLANVEALWHYQPKPLSGHAVLYIRGEGQKDESVEYWRSLTDGPFTVVPVSHDHWHLLKSEEDVSRIAAGIRQITESGSENGRNS